MTTELASTTLAVAEQFRDTDRPLPPHVVAELEQIAGLDTLPAGMRSEARRILIASRAGAK